jgi:DNA-binding transcriptional ArsR family regulator
MLNQSGHESNLDLMFQALADPTRRRIVERLAQGPTSVSELAKPFDMSLPAVVQHLQVLEGSGLVTTKKEGRVRTCTLDAGALTMAEKWINERRKNWEKRLDKLGQLLDSLPDLE